MKKSYKVLIASVATAIFFAGALVTGANAQDPSTGDNGATNGEPFQAFQQGRDFFESLQSGGLGIDNASEVVLAQSGAITLVGLCYSSGASNVARLYLRRDTGETLEWIVYPFNFGRPENTSEILLLETSNFLPNFQTVGRNNVFGSRGISGLASRGDNTYDSIDYISFETQSLGAGVNVAGADCFFTGRRPVVRPAEE